MEQITYINEAGKEIILGETTPYILTKIDGIGSIEAQIQTQKAPFQDGRTYLGSNLSIRNISLQLTILTDNLEDMITKRRKLINIMNTKQNEGRLIYQLGNLKREVKAKIEKGPEFIYDKDFMDTMQKALIEIQCNDPFWYELTTQELEMADWIGGLRFPLQLPMMFSGRSSRQSTVVENKGDVETPATFTFFGPCINPQITNIDTGEFIKIKTELGVNDRLIITTGFGNKRVELENISANTKINAFHLIDLESTFFQLKVGSNLISYKADVGQENAKVWIRWRNRYLGV